MTTKAKWWQAGLFVAGCQAGGFLSSYLGGAFKKADWYDNTKKPSFWPPQWVFPLAWVGNYTFMGLALWQVWRERDRQKIGPALTLFGVHLAQNYAFIPVVYRVKSRGFYSLMDSTAVVLAGLTTRQFARVSRPAARLMLPYMGWLFFTTFLKVRWWRLPH